MSKRGKKGAAKRLRNGSGRNNKPQNPKQVRKEAPEQEPGIPPIEVDNPGQPVAPAPMLSPTLEQISAMRNEMLSRTTPAGSSILARILAAPIIPPRRSGASPSLLQRPLDVVPIDLSKNAEGSSTHEARDSGASTDAGATRSEGGLSAIVTESEAGPSAMVTNNGAGSSNMATDDEAGPSAVATDKEVGPTAMATDNGAGPTTMATDKGTGPSDNARTRLSRGATGLDTETDSTGCSAIEMNPEAGPSTGNNVQPEVEVALGGSSAMSSDMKAGPSRGPQDNASGGDLDAASRDAGAGPSTKLRDSGAGPSTKSDSEAGPSPKEIDEMKSSLDSDRKLKQSIVSKFLGVPKCVGKVKITNLEKLVETESEHHSTEPQASSSYQGYPSEPQASCSYQDHSSDPQASCSNQGTTGEPQACTSSSNHSNEPQASRSKQGNGQLPEEGSPKKAYNTRSSPSSKLKRKLPPSDEHPSTSKESQVSTCSLDKIKGEQISNSTSSISEKACDDVQESVTPSSDVVTLADSDKKCKISTNDVKLEFRHIQDIEREILQMDIVRETNNSPEFGSQFIQQLAASLFKPEGAIVLYDYGLQARWPRIDTRVPYIFLHPPFEFQNHMRGILARKIQFYLPKRGTHYTKIISPSHDDQQKLTQYFDEYRMPYHTFGHPSGKMARVVIRGLSGNIDLDKIKEELTSVSIPVVRLHKMRYNGMHKSAWHIILAIVPHNDEGLRLLKVSKIFGQDVKMEPAKSKTKQCYRCQRWGHAQRFCKGRVKCVKCAGDHFSDQCTKHPEEPPMCANCGGEHTASYKKCCHCPDSDTYKSWQTKKRMHSHKFCRVLATSDNCDDIYIRNYTNKGHE